MSGQKGRDQAEGSAEGLTGSGAGVGRGGFLAASAAHGPATGWKKGRT